MFEIVFLGTAASLPSATRGLPAILVACGPRRVLVDCGEGTQRQILQAGLGFRRLGRILFTHRHFDHVLGLAGLASTMALLGAGDRLALHASPATRRFLERYIEAVWEGRRPSIALDLETLEPGALIAEEGFTIRAFPVEHGGTESFGFLFEMPPRRTMRRDRLDALGIPDGPLRGRLAQGETVVLPDGRRVVPDDVLGPDRPGVRLAVIGDVGEAESLVPQVAGADALVIEATYLARDEALARERGHLTADRAGRLAAAAGVGALYLTHISGRYDPAEIAAEAGRHGVPTRVVADFDRFEVPAPP
jgi:ribonuclease Z